MPGALPLPSGADARRPPAQPLRRRGFRNRPQRRLGGRVAPACRGLRGAECDCKVCAGVLGRAPRLARRARPAVRAARAGEAAAWASLTVGTLVVLSHIYSLDEIRRLGGTVSGPWGGLGVVVLSLAVLTSRPGFGLARILAGRSLGT